MPQNYTPEFKKKIVRLRLEEGRTINSITTEYGISKESVRRWCNEFQKECQAQSLQIPSFANEAEIMKDNLRRELAEKEIITTITTLSGFYTSFSGVFEKFFSF